MKGARPIDSATFAPASAASGPAVSNSRSVRIGRFHLNRGTHHLKDALGAKYVTMRARNSVLAPAGIALQVDSPAAQQDALTAWEDEGGKVRLKSRNNRG